MALRSLAWRPHGLQRGAYGGVLSLAVECLKHAFGQRLLGVILFGSRARGDYRPQSDYDFLVLLDSYLAGPIDDYFSAYRALRPFRETTLRDTTIAIVSIADLREHISSAVLLNALFEGIILYDPRGTLARAKGKLLARLKALGIRRVRASWGYTWRVPRSVKLPFKLEVDIDDPPSHAYRLRLAEEYLKEARLALEAGAFVAAIHEAQLSIENSAKAVIAFFRPPSWIHNPGPELRELVEEELIPSEVHEGALELADLAEEAAPHHAISSYRDIHEMRTPYEIYSREDARELVRLASRALKLAQGILRALGAL